MRAVVVYESLWGNTAAIARAIAEGIGPDTRAVSTAEANEIIAEGADLIVAGAPILGFNLPNEQMRESIRRDPKHADNPADLSHPSARAWLETLPAGTARFATFETRIWWSPGSSAKSIAKRLEELGYTQAAEPEKFIVTGTYGPLKEGEVERARAWGAKLAGS